MKTKINIKIIRFALATFICFNTIIIAKNLIENAKQIYSIEKHQQALACLLDILQ